MFNYYQLIWKEILWDFKTPDAAIFNFQGFSRPGFTGYQELQDPWTL